MPVILFIQYHQLFKVVISSFIFDHRHKKPKSLHDLRSDKIQFSPILFSRFRSISIMEALPGRLAMSHPFTIQDM
ncbi:MAG: hypothetical protein COX19_15420 [Desulfobacterales bacterium CG23_combo_of_CG06-09_8_20_14_all_51_8]|nr:MAG: hypothetical protein COX19_15420 [Desulfobacterales bacterium CG23_combo_of_CG06-09_8_20_14_all_51_8]